MKLRLRRISLNSVPGVIVSTEDWDRADLDAMVRFGEPSVEIGGRFEKRPCEPRPGREPPEPCPDSRDCLQEWLAQMGLYLSVEDSSDSGDSGDSSDYCDGYSDEKDYFTVPCARKGVRSGFPVFVEFSPEVFADPARVAGLWADEIARRVAFEVRGLRMLRDIVQKEETYEI